MVVQMLGGAVAGWITDKQLSPSMKEQLEYEIFTIER